MLLIPCRDPAQVYEISGISVVILEDWSHSMILLIVILGFDYSSPELKIQGYLLFYFQVLEKVALDPHLKYLFRVELET